MSASRDSKTSHEHDEAAVERFPFDPSLQPERVDGLDRLRCISDRGLAVTLYKIYVHTERCEARHQREHEKSARAQENRKRIRDRLTAFARQALEGTLGPDAEDLAICLVTDGAGNVRCDDRALAQFGRALAELGVLQSKNRP